MKLDWPNLIVGAILGFFVHWSFVASKERFALWKLKKRYAPLAGNYANFRVKEDQTVEPTGGTVRLLWQQRDGSFKAQGLTVNGIAEWESTIRMSKDFNETGVGHYRYVGREDSGNQQVTYSPETRSFVVLGTNTSGTSRQFFHRWKRIETITT